MNAQAAEPLLRCHRAGRRVDSRMQRALRFAERDPERRRKLAEQQEFDGQIVAAVRCIQPPDDFRRKLRAHGDASGEQSRGMRSQWKNPAVISAVTGLLVIVALIVFLVIERMEKFPGRESVERMIESAGKLSGVDFEPVAAKTGQLGDWFYMRGYEGFETPAELATLPALGARVFRLNGKPIAQLAVDQHDSILYEFRATDFGVQLAPDGDWQTFEQDEWTGAIREHAGHCWVVAFRGDRGEMREFLKSLTRK